MLIEVTILIPTSTCQLITHQHSRTMKISHIGEEHNNVKDLGKICNNIMLHLGSKNNNNNSHKEVREKKIREKEISSFEEQMLAFIGENKRLLNIHEQKFADLATFQANTTMF